MTASLTSTAMSDLLHSALNRAAFQAVSPTVPERGRFSALSLEDDSDLIPVETPINSPPASVASSRNSSRSSSPTRRSRSGAGKPRRDKTAEKAKEQANRESRDPLVRLENVVSERIFRELGVDDLLACGAVCKRWRGSHTISTSPLRCDDSDGQTTRGTSFSSRSHSRRSQRRRSPSSMLSSSGPVATPRSTGGHGSRPFMLHR